MPGTSRLTYALDHLNRAQTDLAKYLDNAEPGYLVGATESTRRAYQLLLEHRPMVVAVPHTQPKGGPVRAEADGDE